eukprot:CAMPEP_0181362586 /NCGR_PEP_ID=MMETSP1106-20121128/8118_1 /TAXON_ID=81844 /ORGANISM="Mantoniella antarctica, Strain SL-175" /LENGTH=514 /DNA_ID=CAMNT_0023476615 /DNA_START=417 /DNA_END=1961 /DNA_ORIENTATION=-
MPASGFSAAAFPVLLAVVVVLSAGVPGANADDYAGDYALFAGHNSGCTFVNGSAVENGQHNLGGFTGPAQQVPTSAAPATSILYARFYVRTPYTFRGGTDPSNTETNTLLFLGGPNDSTQCAGYVAGLKRGKLFFGVGCDPDDAKSDTDLEAVSTQLTGEFIKAEFVYNRNMVDAVSNVVSANNLKIYVDGALLIEGAKAFTLPAPLDQLTIGYGGHATAANGWDGGFRAINAYREPSAAEVYWCPMAWTGAVPPIQPLTLPTPALDVRALNCQPIVSALNVPKWSQLGAAYNGMTTYRGGATLDLTQAAFTSGGSYAYVRIRMMTPAFFSRIPGEGIKLFGFGSDDSTVDGGYCGAIDKVQVAGVFNARLSVYQCTAGAAGARSPIVTHAASLTPSTRYLLEFKFDVTASTVEMYAQGALIKTGAFSTPALSAGGFLQLGYDLPTNPVPDPPVWHWGREWGVWNSGEVYTCPPVTTPTSSPTPHPMPEGECEGACKVDYEKHGFQNMVAAFTG